jgi:flagellar biosynthesis chaperone FliJ
MDVLKDLEITLVQISVELRNYMEHFQQEFENFMTTLHSQLHEKDCEISDFRREIEQLRGDLANVARHSQNSENVAQ